MPGEAGRPSTRPLDVPPLAQRRIAGNAALTAAAQVVTMGIGGVLAILILVDFGKNAKTDGLFAAYGAYGVIVALAQSFRGTIVARLLEGPSLAANLDRFLGSALLIFGAVAVAFVALGDPVAHLLTGSLGHDAVDSARISLAILWVATGGQLVAALASASLAVYDDYRGPAIGYAGGSILALAVLVALADPVGIAAVPIALATASLTAATVTLWRLRRFGYRPRPARLAAGARSGGSIKVLLAASAAPIAGQVTYVVSLAAAARLGEGAVTLYAYAFFAAMVLVGASAAPIGTVMAAAISESWDRRPESLEPSLVAVLRAGYVLIVPALGVVAIAGKDVIDLLVGSRLSGGDATDIVTAFLGLSGALIVSVAQIVPSLAAFAAGMYGRVALASIVIVAAQIGSAAIAVAIGNLLAVALAASITALVSLVLLTFVIYGRATLEALTLLARELTPVLIVAALSFGPLGFAARTLGPAGHGAAAVLGLALFAILLSRRLPGYRQLVVDALAPLRERRAGLP